MEKLADVIRIYNEYPLDNGDMVVVTDSPVVQELERMADEWDPVIRRNVAHVLREIGATEVQLLFARPDAEMLPQDHAIWADLRDELDGSGITLHPPTALPAAA
jgi:hypothetical protein